MREIAIVTVLFAVAAVIQPILVYLDHPDALWLWCTLLRVC